MLSKKHIPIIIFILLNICYANDKIIRDEKDTIVAKIGQNYIVTFKDLSQYVNEWQYNLKYHNRSKYVAYKVALDALINNQMKRFDFFDRRLNENKDLMRSMNRIINEELSVEYFKKLFNSEYVNEEKARETYKLMGKEVIYYQIVLPLHGDENKSVLDSLKEKAIKIQNDLSNSKNVENYIKNYSDKNAILDNPKKISWEQSITDPVGNVIFNLKKGFTRVIISFDGYHIVKVTDIKKISLEPFEKMKNDIMTKLRDVLFPDI